MNTNTNRRIVREWRITSYEVTIYRDDSRGDRCRSFLVCTYGTPAKAKRAALDWATAVAAR